MNEHEKKKDTQKKINHILLQEVIKNLDELERDLEKDENTYSYRVGLNKRILEKIIGTFFNQWSIYNKQKEINNV